MAAAAGRFRVMLQVARVTLIVLCVVGAVLIGALAHQRREQQTPAQAMIRAGVLLFVLAAAMAALAGLLGLDPWLRVTPPLAAVVVMIVGLVEDTAAVIRDRPRRGPFALVTKLLRRVGR